MLAHRLPAELVLFRAVLLPSDANEILDDADSKKHRFLEQLEAQACDYLNRVVNRLQETDLGVQSVVRLEPAAEAIVNYAEQMDIQQIVMSTHGYSGFSRLKHGSVAEGVLQLTHVPVLMVCVQRDEEHDVHKPEICRRILVPLDGSHVAEQILAPVTAVAQGLDAEIVLFRVSMVSTTGSLTGNWYQPLEGSFGTADEIAEAYLDRVADCLREQRINVSTAIRRGAVADAIVEFVETNHIDLVAMCTHGRRVSERWTLGSVAERVLRARRTPVLLVRAQVSPAFDTRSRDENIDCQMRKYYAC
jgi:nucleotide-binding universal stress UspA family protein